MHTLIFFRNNACKEAAYVLSFSGQDKFSVLIPRFGIEGSIALKTVCESLEMKMRHVDPSLSSSTVVGWEVNGRGHSCDIFLEDTVVSKAGKGRKKGQGQGHVLRRELVRLEVFQKVEVFISVKQSPEKSGGYVAIALVHDGHVLEK